MKIRIPLLLLPIVAVLISSVTAFSASASEDDYTQYFLDSSRIEDFDVYYSAAHIKELIHERYPEVDYDHYFMSVTSSTASGSYPYSIQFCYLDNISAYAESDIYSVYQCPFAVHFLYGSDHQLGSAGTYPTGSYLYYDKQTGQSFVDARYSDSFVNSDSVIDRETNYIFYQTSNAAHFPIAEGVNTYCSKVFSSSFFSNVVFVYNFALSLILSNGIALVFIGVPLLLSAILLFSRMQNRRLS